MRIWVVPLLLLSGLQAQEPERAKAIGRVLDASGAGVAGANVTLVHRAIGWAREYGTPDVVTIIADDNGRFAAQLYAGRSYSAFASWRVGEQPVVTSIKEHVASGEFAELRQLTAKVIGFHVRLDGQEPWADHGPLSFRVCLHLANMHSLPVAADADGLIPIPSLPGGSGTFEVLTKDGHVLWASWIGSKHDDRRSAAANRKGGVINRAALTLPKPISIELEVIDAKTNKPVPHAKLRHRSGWLGYGVPFSVLDAADWSLEYWRPVGVTNALGKATVVVPAKGNPWTTDEKVNITLSARAAGYAEAFAGWSDGFQHNDLKTRRQSDRPLRMMMHAEMPVSGRLTLDGATPAAHLPILLSGHFDISNLSRSGGVSMRAPILVTQTDDQGAFSFPAAPIDLRLLHLVVPLDDPAVRAKLTRDGFAPPPIASPFAKAGLMVLRYQRSLRNFGDTSLGLEQAIMLRLLTPDGHPVRGGQVSLMSGTGFSQRMAVHGTTDSGGRCLLLPSDPEQMIVVIVPDVGYAIEPIGKPGEMRLTLQPFSHATGRVLWDDGAAAAHARIACGGSNPSGLLAANWQLVRKLNDDLCGGRADADGKFRVAYIPSTAVSLRMFATANRNGSRHSVRFAIQAEPGTPEAAIEVKIER
tara:strand:+ start:2714 stop:4639 length:1926 start_codon:yes stop_codon:yes gene_type:complete